MLPNTSNDLAYKLEDAAQTKTGKAYLESVLAACLYAFAVEHASFVRLSSEKKLSVVATCSRHTRPSLIANGAKLQEDYLENLLSQTGHGGAAQTRESVLVDDSTNQYGCYIATLSYGVNDVHPLLLLLESSKSFIIKKQYRLLLDEQASRLLLESDNIELRKQLEARQRELDFIKSYSTDLYWTMDAAGCYSDLSPQCRMIYGYEPDDMQGRHYTEFMSDTSAEQLRYQLQQASTENEACNIMATHTDRNNNPVHVNTHIITRYDEQGRVVGYNGITSDVTGAVNAERIIKNNSELFSSILSRLPVIFFRIDENGIIVDIRGNGLERMGVNDMDWVGKPGYGLFLGMDQMIDAALSGEAVHFRSRGSYQGKPWWFYTSMFFDSWTGFGAVGFSVDITDQVAGEEKLVQLLQDNRILAQRLVEVQEDERRNLARELHDELGQSITAVKSLAKAITATTGNTYSEVRSLGNSIIDLSGRLYDVVNNIMQRLRPDVMDSTIGFASTIRSCVVRSQLEKTGVNVDIRIHGNINDLDEVVKITIYRIIQEALTNISKYAMASNVEILLRRKKSKAGSASTTTMKFHEECEDMLRRLNARDILLLQITDDGVGMDIQKHPRSSFKRQKMGLQGIRERITALGGELILDSARGKGLVLCTILDLQVRNSNGQVKIRHGTSGIDDATLFRRVMGD